MTDNNSNKSIEKIAQMFSSKFDVQKKETAIILAAGHGKRIKSHKSKMLHKIWGLPTVQRVYNACKNGIKKANLIIVVGIKAENVIKVIGKNNNTLFAFQEKQNGTGHAVQIALNKIPEKNYDGIIYVFPGDMGLIDKKTIAMFRQKFKHSHSDMMVLTGHFKGKPKNNSYGRIIRVKEKDMEGNLSGEDYGKVIEILEHKDILKLGENELYKLQFNGKTYSYSKKELIENNEFNSGVYAFYYQHLKKFISQIKNDNIQKEIYITDLISIFNRNGLSVSAVSPQSQHVIMGFNNKSVLKKMEDIAREMQYERIKNIIEIEDPDDFFIDEKVIDNIIEKDKKEGPLDIHIGKGVFIGKGVRLNYNLTLKKNVRVDGNIIFGQNVTIWENVQLSCFQNQKFIIEDNVEILWGDIIKGNIVIGKNSRIESSVNMTGSDEFPLRIGENVTIKGTSYLFGSIIEDELFIEHSVLIKKKVNRLIKKDGTDLQIKFFLPMPEGIDAIEDI